MFYKKENNFFVVLLFSWKKNYFNPKLASSDLVGHQPLHFCPYLFIYLFFNTGYSYFPNYLPKCNCFAAIQIKATNNFTSSDLKRLNFDPHQSKNIFILYSKLSISVHFARNFIWLEITCSFWWSLVTSNNLKIWPRIAGSTSRYLESSC